MNYAEWCEADDLEADPFSLDIWRQTPEFRESWERHAAKFGDNAKSWKQYCRKEWEELMKKSGEMK
jgi:hypothetical protein